MASTTRDRLIEVARQLFSRQGVAHTTMNDIANASSKGRRTIYTYFKNKREIYNAVLDGESDRIAESLRRVATEAAPVEQRLAKFLRLGLERYFGEDEGAGGRQWLKFDSKRLLRIRRMVRAKENAMLSALLAEGVRNGTFNPDRCRLFISSNFIFDVLADGHNNPPMEKEQLRDAIENFITFIVTDLTVSANQA